MAIQQPGQNWIDKLPEPVRQEVRQCMRQRRFGKGEIIYSEGKLHHALWQVIEGSVRVVNQTADGKEVIFALFGPGDCFGEMCLLEDAPAANSAITNSKAVLAELSRGDFQQLYQRHPAVADQLARLLCNRVRNLLNFYSDVTLKSLDQRIASRIGYLSAGTDNGLASGELQFTQQDLADMVGATRQAVSKILNLWREHNIIELTYGRINIIQREQLAKIAEGSLQLD